MRYNGVLHWERYEHERREKVVFKKDLGSNENINSDYLFMKDGRRRWGGAQISGPHNSLT